MARLGRVVQHRSKCNTPMCYWAKVPMNSVVRFVANTMSTSTHGNQREHNGKATPAQTGRLTGGWSLWQAGSVEPGN